MLTLLCACSLLSFGLAMGSMLFAATNIKYKAD